MHLTDIFIRKLDDIIYEKSKIIEKEKENIK
jgi:hypothetical protein